MEIKPLICPQCGGEITNYSPGQTYATCGYCSMMFLIDPGKPAPHDLPVPELEEIDNSPTIDPNRFVTMMAVVLAVIFGVIIIGSIASWKGSKSPATVSGMPVSSTPGPQRSSSSTESNPNLLEFGGKGTDNGLFKDANSIAVDRQGRIYVSDDSLRVQQFDEKGGFLRAWQIPKKTANYERAHTIDKIAVGEDGKVYVAVGGVIQVYDERSVAAMRTIHVAPDYIQDFALKSDGGLLAISDDDRDETLLFVNRAGRITKRIRGFHTDALDAAISPQETAVAAIRIAVDRSGNIFSVYAFGDLGSYSISSNNEDLMIARFSPEGKFLRKFAQSMNSCGIEIDSKGRIYLSDSEHLDVYSNTGELINVVGGLSRMNAFALDKDNNVYVLTDDRVIKRPAVE